VPLVATHLNQPMLDYALARGVSPPMIWRQADTMALLFRRRNGRCGRLPVGAPCSFRTNPRLTAKRDVF
jgi:hypothetical protein